MVLHFGVLFGIVNVDLSEHHFHNVDAQSHLILENSLFVKALLDIRKVLDVFEEVPEIHLLFHLQELQVVLLGLKHEESLIIFEIKVVINLQSLISTHL